MKFFGSIATFLVFLFFLPMVTHATTLQEMIDKATPGETVILSEEEYEETVVINKAITLKGNEETVIRSCEKQPIITITGENVRLEGIKVDYCGDEKEATAISVTGTDHKLSNFEVRTTGFGMKLNDAHGVRISDGMIIGTRKENGIDLWNSTSNLIEKMRIARMKDGIYLEQSNDNTLRENNIRRSRYGMHVMFSSNNRLEDNIAQSNMAGTMLMRVNRIHVKGNDFSFNSSNVNSQGLLVYYTENGRFEDNLIKANRVGIYMENSKENVMTENIVADNFIGVQFSKSSHNQVVKNTFYGNVNEAQAIDSSQNKINQNYWDASEKIDVSGKGESIIPFSADPFFLTVTEEIPEYQLFFQAPGMVLLQNMLKSSEDQVLIDKNPLMESPVDVNKETSSGAKLWTMAAVMIIVSSCLYYFGRKRI